MFNSNRSTEILEAFIWNEYDDQVNLFELVHGDYYQHRDIIERWLDNSGSGGWSNDLCIQFLFKKHFEEKSMTKQLFPSGNLPKASVIAEMLVDLEQRITEALVIGDYTSVTPKAQFRINSDGYMRVLVLIRASRDGEVELFLKGVIAAMGYTDVLVEVLQ